MFSPYTSWKLKVKGIQFIDPIFIEDVKNCLSNLELKFYGNAVYIDKNHLKLKHQRESQCMSVFETEEIYDISTLRWQKLSSLFVGVYNIVVPFEKADVGMS